MRKAFHVEFGRSPREYHTALRLLKAIEDIGVGKVEGVALGVGYKSKKNFYRMFRSLTGLTPTGFRQLTVIEQQRAIGRAWKDVHMGRRDGLPRRT